MEARTTAGSTWATSLVFAIAYALAAMVGRLTVIDQGAGLGLFWPAAGLGALWMLIRGGLYPLDLALFAAVTFAVNHLTGSSVSMALVLTGANLLQLVAFLWLLGVLLPTLWGVGGNGRIDSVRSLIVFLGAAVVSAHAGATLGSLGLWLLTGHFDPLTTLIWVCRNLFGLFAVGCIGHLIAHAVRFRADPVLAPPGRRVPFVEVLLLVVLTIAGYLAVFATGPQLVFPLLPLTIWAGLRLSTLGATVHAFLCVLFTLVLTRNGLGPFAVLGDPVSTALFVQLYGIVAVLMAMLLATMSDEQRRSAAELVRAEREAATHADLLQNTLEAMHDSVVVIEGERLVFANPSAKVQLRASGLDEGSSISEVPALLPDGSGLPPAEQPLAKALSGEAVSGLDLMLDSRVGPRVMSVSARPLSRREPDSEPRAVLVFRDVTEEREQRADLMTFAGAVAHDLRNPVQVMEGWLEQLEDALDEARAGEGQLDHVVAHSMVANAQGATGRMNELIQDLLDHALATNREIRRGRMDLGAVAREVAAGRSVTMSVGEVPHVWADPVLSRQLLDNLIGNAVKYVAPGVEARVHVAGERAGDQVLVRVCDNGIGVPAGQHERIFGEFERAHRDAGYSGSGLGLSMCRRIVERHGGSIRSYDNPDGPGTVFEFSLPAAR